MDNETVTSSFAARFELTTCELQGLFGIPDMPTVITVNEVLFDLEAYVAVGNGLYVPTGRRRIQRDPESKWNLTLLDACAVLDIYETDGPDEDPEYATQNALTYACLIDAVVDVRENLRGQLDREPTRDEVLTGLNYFLNNDAFIRVQGAV